MLYISTIILLILFFSQGLNSLIRIDTPVGRGCKIKKNRAKTLVGGLFIKHKILKLILWVIVSLCVGLSMIYIYDKYRSYRENTEVIAYGQKHSVYDSQLNVVIEGEGSETIVLLSGYGTVSPGLDYRALIDELKKSYKVVVIEPFGYGLSGQTTRERTLDNMSEEIHTVLQQLNIESYILMGHSISGFYALNYTNRYIDEVLGFIGLDSSVPNQPNETIPTKQIRTLHQLGLIRLGMKLNPNHFFLNRGTKKESQQYEILSNRNIGNPTVMAEGDALVTFYEEVKGVNFPKKLPVLLLIAQESVDNVAEWETLHQRQANSVIKGQVKILPGLHYLHHSQSEAIMKATEKFITETIKFDSWLL